MEVHHHAHSERKKWTHYVWEFLMLFLAVTLGFFVENQREHYVEGIREKEYIESIVEDLKADTALIRQFQIEQNQSIKYYDSVLLLLDNPERTSTEQKDLYYFVRMAMRLSWPIRANKTAYEQMKNSGNLRLLHNFEISDSISKYYFKLNEINYITELMTLRQQAVTEYEAKIFDGNAFQKMIEKNNVGFSRPEENYPLITSDKMIINEFKVRVHYLSAIMSYSLLFSRNQSIEAMHLIEYLEEEYYLK